MAAPVYATDLTDITTAETITGWSALGGGQSGLQDETDYFIQGNQCVSKNGFTGSTRGQIFNAGATTIASGDAVFFWIKQNNRNLMDTVANGGTQALIGSGTNAYDRFNVDGSDSDGSALAGWRTYAVDPTATPSNTTGSPSGTSYFGAQWAILGSGSLKGAPNGIDVIRHGRELQCTEGDLGNGYATFDGAAVFDSDTTRSWGLLTPIAGGYQFHGLFAFGVTGTAVDFRDSNRNIVILDDPFVPSTFNAFEVRNSGSNVELTSVQITALGTTSRGDWITTDNGTVALTGCVFTDMGDFDFQTNTTVTDCTFRRVNQITQAGATISGGLVDDATATAAFVMDDDSAVSGINFTDNTTAIDATAAIVSDEVNLTDMTFSGNTTDITVNSANDITVNNLGTSNASTCTNTGAGNCTIVSSAPLEVTVIDADTGSPVEGAAVYLETDPGGTSVLNGVTNSSGVFSGSFGGSTPQAVTGWVRSGSGQKAYQDFALGGSIVSSGYTATALLSED